MNQDNVKKYIEEVKIKKILQVEDLIQSDLDVSYEQKAKALINLGYAKKDDFKPIVIKNRSRVNWNQLAGYCNAVREGGITTMNLIRAVKYYNGKEFQTNSAIGKLREIGGKASHDRYTEEEIVVALRKNKGRMVDKEDFNNPSLNTFYNMFTGDLRKDLKLFSIGEICYLADIKFYELHHQLAEIKGLADEEFNNWISTMNMYNPYHLKYRVNIQEFKVDCRYMSDEELCEKYFVSQPNIEKLKMKNGEI